MPQPAERHAARASLLVLALMIALGGAMCVRVHRGVASPGVRGAARAGETAPTAPTSGVERGHG